jgi:phenylalanyl-tRNA synthetase beta chain
MKVPISWLNEYVDLNGVSAASIADKLTFSGIEVEGIHPVGGDFPGVVAGEVRAIRQHPNADRLRLCEVFNGQELLAVVCGASNFEVGDKAAFAGVGTVLPNGMKLKKSKIRGEESLGMLCAEDELGISDEHDGILLLPRETVAGTPLREVLGPADTVLELEITWNRPDCLSVIGVARELAALYGKPLKMPAFALVESSQPVADLVSVRVEDTACCPRYTARVLTDVKIGPSPVWMQQRLTLCGVRPICNVVDVTNYVMLECGQPLHAFDYKLLTDGQIVVRRAVAGETMVTLDAVERRLTASMLVIADARTPVAVAGVMGGAGSEISDATATVLLESAAFDPRSIRQTSSALGLSSESSHRFERRVDTVGVAWASERAAALMQELAAGQVAKGMVDVYPAPLPSRTVSLEPGRLRRVLGTEVSAARVREIFESLALPVKTSEDGVFTVTVPSFRPDLECEADLIEEVARMHGLEHIPDTVPSATVVPGADDSATRALFRCREALAGLGLREMMSYSFTAAPLLDAFDAGDHARRVVLPNPVSADQGVLRHTLLPQMVECLARNHARQVESAALFEIGTVFCRDEQGKIEEHTAVAFGLTGQLSGDSLKARDAVRDEDAFLALKGIIEQLAVVLRTGRVSFCPAHAMVCEPGTAVDVCLNGERLGFIGLLRRDLRQARRLSDPVAVGELTLNPLLVNVFQTPVYQAVPSYPSTSRDMAMVVDAGVTHGQIMQVIENNMPGELTGVRLFDIFQGDGVRQGHKSLGYSLTYQSAERTLTDEEANARHEAIKDALRRELGVTFREG